jgi:hypothetical protein
MMSRENERDWEDLDLAPLTKDCILDIKNGNIKDLAPLTKDYILDIKNGNIKDLAPLTKYYIKNGNSPSCGTFFPQTFRQSHLKTSDTRSASCGEQIEIRTCQPMPRVGKQNGGIKCTGCEVAESSFSVVSSEQEPIKHPVKPSYPAESSGTFIERHRYKEIEEFYGFQRDLFLVKIVDDDGPVWLYEWQVRRIMTSKKWANHWIDFAKKAGKPSQVRGKGQWQPLKGALTRSMLRSPSDLSVAEASGVAGSIMLRSPSDLSVAEASGLVPFQSSKTPLCFINSYLNYACTFLSEAQRAAVKDIPMKEAALSKMTNDENWPVQMRTPIRVFTLPSEEGYYLVSRSPVHTDLVNVLADGSFRFYPSDSRVSRCILTARCDYVDTFLNQNEDDQIIVLFRPMRATMTKAQKRKRQRQNSRVAKKCKRT